MIVRPNPNWFRMLFVLRGSVLPRISRQLVATTVFAAVITCLHGQVLDWKITLTFVPFSLIGLTLAIFLSFRNSTSYDRYWEARTLWGTILNETRSLTRQAQTLTVADAATVRLLAMRLCAFVHTLRHQLRDSDAGADITRLLGREDSARLRDARFKPAIVLLLVGEWVRDRLEKNELAPPIVPAMEASLGRLSTALGGCERIDSTPIPFTYSVIIHRSVYLYCFLLPFGLVDSIGWMTPLVVCFIAYTFFALEALGAEISDPFGTEPNDLALDAMSAMIESTLREMIGETQTGEEIPRPENYILS